MPHSFAYAQSSYEVPINADPQVLINGIDARSFGAELVSLPDIALPGTRQQTIDLSDRNHAQYARDLYTGFNFDLTFQMVGLTPTDLNQKITDLLSFLANEQQRRNSSYVQPVIVEFPSLYLVSDEGTVSHTGTTSITGSGTRFKDFGANGDLIKFAGDSKKYHIKSVTSNTSITLYESPSGSASGVAYNLYRRRYLKARYSGSSSHSSPVPAPFLRDRLSTSRKPIVRDVTISFYTDESYWLGSAKRSDITVSSQTNFHVIDGIGNAGFEPQFTIPTTQSLSSPKIYTVRHNFLSNFNGDANYKNITNQEVAVTSTSGNRQTLELRNESVTGNGSMYIESGAEAKFLSSRFSSNQSDTNSYTTINYNQGHLSTWVKRNVTDSNTAYIIDFGANNNLKVYYDDSSNDVYAMFGGTGTYVNKVLSTTDFYNIQVSWNTNVPSITVSVYDGSSTSSANGVILQQDAPSQYVFVGSDSSGSNSFNGYIDEIVIWNRPLTSSEQDTLRSGANPKSIAPQHIQSHIGTDASEGSTGIDTVVADDNERYLPTQDVTRTAISGSDYASRDSFTVNLSTLNTSQDFDVHSSSIPSNVMMYDDTGMRGSFEVSGKSTSSLTLKNIYNDSLLLSDDIPGVGETAAPDEIGVHAKMDGVSTTPSTGGDWYARLSAPYMMTPSAATHDLAVTAWVNIDTNISSDLLNHANATLDDKYYLISSVGASSGQGIGWGVAFDANSKPVFKYNRLDTPPNYNQANASYTSTNFTGSTEDILTYEQTTSGEINAISSVTVNLSGTAINSVRHISVWIRNGTNDTLLASQFVPVTTTSESNVIFYNNSSLAWILDYNEKIIVKSKHHMGTNTGNVIHNSQVRWSVPGILENKVLQAPASCPSLNDGKWHHIAVVYRDTLEDTYSDPASNIDLEVLMTGDVYFYVDGVLYGSGQQITRASFGANQSKMPFLGYNPNSQYNFPGKFKDVRVFSASGLSDSDANDLKSVKHIMSHPNGGSVMWLPQTNNDNYREVHWYKMMGRSGDTLINDYGYVSGNVSSNVNLHLYGANQNSTYGQAGREQKSYLSKGYFYDPVSTETPYKSLFQPFNYYANNGIPNADMMSELGVAYHDMTSDGSVSPIIGKNMMRIDSAVGNYSLAMRIERPASRFMSMVLRGYVYTTYDPYQFLEIESVDSPTDFTSRTILSKYSNSNTGSWEYFEIAFNRDDYSGTTSGHYLVKIKSPTSGYLYLSGLDIRRNYAKGGSVSQTSDSVTGWGEVYTSDSGTSIGHGTADSGYENSGSYALAISANQDSQGVRLENSAPYKGGGHFYVSTQARTDTGVGNLGVYGERSTNVVDKISEIPLTTSYSRSANHFKFRTTSTTSTNTNLVFKDVSDYRLDDISILEQKNLAYTKTSTTVSGNNPTYVFGTQDLSVSLTNRSLLYYNNVEGLGQHGSAIIRIKPNSSTSTSNIDNLILNSGAESVSTWNKVPSSSDYSSTSTLYSSGSASINASNGIYQNLIGLESGKTYVVKSKINGSATVSFGPHALNVANGSSDTSTMSSTSFTRNVTGGNGWQTVIDYVNGTDANYMLKVTSTGTAYIDDISIVEANESSFDSVLFSWHADDGGNPDTNDYLRLAYSSNFGFIAQRCIAGTFETLAVADATYDSNNSLEVAFNWDENPMSDDFTGDKLYGIMVVNGSTVGLSKSQLTSTNVTYKHLIVGCQGGYNSGVVGSSFVDAVIDGLMISNRVLPIEEMIETYRYQESLKSSNDVLSMPAMDTSSEYFVYKDGSAFTSKSSSSHSESIKKSMTSSVNDKRFGVNDNERVVLYSDMGGSPSSSFDISLDYEPRFR